MPDRWNYKHDGAVQGPVPREKLEQLAGIGALFPADPVWLEGDDPRGAVEALSILDLDCFRKVLDKVDEALANTPSVPGASPDWLSDVQSDAGPAVSSDSSAVPAWVNDVQATSGPAPASRPSVPKPQAPKPTVIKLARPVAPKSDAEESEEETEPFQFRRRDLIVFALGGLGVGLAVLLGFYFSRRSQRAIEAVPQKDVRPEEKN
jgi:hypothetical protein